MKMKLLKRSRYIQHLLLCLSIAVFSQGFQLIQPMDEQLPIETISMELNQTIMEVWCNGVNYTELCRGWPGWPDPRRCFGEIIQAEVATIRKVADLYDYSEVSLGDMLMKAKCEVNETMQVHSEEEDNNEEIYFWIVVLVSASVLGLLALLAVISVRLYNKRGSMDTSINSTSSTIPSNTTAIKKETIIQEI